MVIDGGSLADVLGRLENIADGTRRDGLQLWNDVQTQFVAHHIGLQIGGVGDISLMLPGQPCFNLLATDTEQGTENKTIARLDA